jgi:hypothetical protein
MDHRHQPALIEHDGDVAGLVSASHRNAEPGKLGDQQGEGWP